MGSLLARRRGRSGAVRENASRRLAQHDLLARRQQMSNLRCHRGPPACLRSSPRGLRDFSAAIARLRRSTFRTATGSSPLKLTAGPASADIREQGSEFFRRHLPSLQEHGSHLSDRCPGIPLRKDRVGAIQLAHKTWEDRIGAAGFCKQFKCDRQVILDACVGVAPVPIAGMESRQAQISRMAGKCDENISPARPPASFCIDITIRLRPAETHARNNPSHPRSHDRVRRFVDGVQFAHGLAVHGDAIPDRFDDIFLLSTARARPGKSWFSLLGLGAESGRGQDPTERIGRVRRSRNPPAASRVADYADADPPYGSRPAYSGSPGGRRAGLMGGPDLRLARAANSCLIWSTTI